MSKESKANRIITITLLGVGFAVWLLIIFGVVKAL